MEKANQQDLKHRIIDAARQVLLSEGYRNLSLRKIAGNIDVTATSIYLHFKNKDDLVHTLIDESIEMLNQRLAECTEPGQTSVQKLRKLARTYVRFGLDHPRQYQIIYLVSSDEMARYPKEKFRKARQGYEIVQKVLEEGTRAGEMKERKPRIAAYTFWAQLHGVMSVVLSQRLDRQIDQDEFIQEAIGHIISAYRNKPLLETAHTKN